LRHAPGCLAATALAYRAGGVHTKHRKSPQGLPIRDALSTSARRVVRGNTTAAAIRDGQPCDCVSYPPGALTPGRCHGHKGGLTRIVFLLQLPFCREAFSWDGTGRVVLAFSSASKEQLDALQRDMVSWDATAEYLGKFFWRGLGTEHGVGRFQYRPRD